MREWGRLKGRRFIVRMSPVLVAPDTPAPGGLRLPRRPVFMDRLRLLERRVALRKLRFSPGGGELFAPGDGTAHVGDVVKGLVKAAKQGGQGVDIAMQLIQRDLSVIADQVESIAVRGNTLFIKCTSKSSAFIVDRWLRSGGELAIQRESHVRRVRVT